MGGWEGRVGIPLSRFDPPIGRAAAMLGFGDECMVWEIKFRDFLLNVWVENWGVELRDCG